MRPHDRRVELLGYGGRGLWTPDHVAIHDDQGRLLAERAGPRASFSRLDRQVRWDKLDLLNFAGYALWNYLSFPFLLEEPGVELIDTEADGDIQCLITRFATEVPTHCATQTFRIDRAGRLTRHDYNADVIGRWAKAAYFCLASETVDGLRFYTRRRVMPRLGAGVMPWPELVLIDIDDIPLR